MLLIARIGKHKTIKDTIQLVAMLTNKVESSAEYLLRLASLSPMYLALSLRTLRALFLTNWVGFCLPGHPPR